MKRPSDGVYGLLVADAFGVPYEFHAPTALPSRAALAMTPPPGFRRAHPGVPPGTWSDDGAQALALLDSLLTRGAVDADDLGARFVAWWRRGAYTPDGVMFDVGIQTSRALGAIEGGVPARDAGPSGERDNGNGSLMRVLPLALWHVGDDAALARDAAAQSRVTHGHPRSQVACALACLWARRLAVGAADAFGEALGTLDALLVDDAEGRRELDEHLRSDAPFGGGG